MSRLESGRNFAVCSTHAVETWRWAPMNWSMVFDHHNDHLDEPIAAVQLNKLVDGPSCLRWKLPLRPRRLKSRNIFCSRGWRSCVDSVSKRSLSAQHDQQCSFHPPATVEIPKKTCPPLRLRLQPHPEALKALECHLCGILLGIVDVLPAVPEVGREVAAGHTHTAGKSRLVPCGIVN